MGFPCHRDDVPCRGGEPIAGRGTGCISAGAASNRLGFPARPRDKRLISNLDHDQTKPSPIHKTPTNQPGESFVSSSRRVAIHQFRRHITLIPCSDPTIPRFRSMLNLTSRSEDSIDPLSSVIAPPADETPEQRTARQAREAEARRVSERIDEQIKLEKQSNSRKRAPVKILMLGQAESGTPLSLPSFCRCADAIIFCTCVQESRRR